MPLSKDYRGLLDCETRPLNAEETQVFFTMSMIHDDEVQGMLPGLEKVFTFKILKGRCEMHNISVEDRLLIFVASLCKNPGHCVLWAYTLKMLQYILEGKQVTLDYFARGPFGYGIPTDSAIHLAWDAQKIKGEDKEAGSAIGLAHDNYLDKSEAWDRLQEEEEEEEG